MEKDDGDDDDDDDDDVDVFCMFRTRGGIFTETVLRKLWYSVLYIIGSNSLVGTRVCCFKKHGAKTLKIEMRSYTLTRT